MKRMILIFAMSYIYISSFAQKNINGVYYDGNGRRLEVFNNKFLYAMSWHDLATWYSDIIAEASFTWVNDDFIELHAVSTKSKIDSALSIIKTYNPKQKNGIRVTFSIPELRHRKLKVTIYRTTKNDLNNFRKIRERRFSYQGGDGIKTFRFSNKKNWLKFSIVPAYYRPNTIDEGDGYYNSYIEYSIPYEVLGDSINNVAITVTNFDDAYFGRNEINGEYVKIEDDKLIWRGRTYTKGYDKYSTEYIKKKELGIEASRNVPVECIRINYLDEFLKDR